MKHFELSDLIFRAVSEKGYLTATPVQELTIPLAMSGKDLLVSAQTGTGKTASFLLPMLHRLQKKGKVKTAARMVRALVLTPTRELAAQVADSVRVYGKYLPLRSAAIYGGVAIGPQMKQLRSGVDVLVATPGRLLDHISQGTVDLSKVEIFVLDEADRMLDMGFIHDITKILSLLPKERQGLLFSATFSNEIKRLADGFLKSAQTVEVPRQPVEPISQLVHPVDHRRKRELLTHLIRTNKWGQVLVFARTKHGADRLAMQLEEDGIPATAIHGNKSQGARMKALAQFKRGAVQALVATDVAARGLDIHQLPHVVNFDLPEVPEDYVHRIGRTGRAGNVGEALSLVSVDEKHLLRNIERLLKEDLPKEVVAGFEPDPSIRPQPIRRRRGGGFSGGRSDGGRASRNRFSRDKRR